MAEVIDVDMAESQPEKAKRLREATNVHSDDAADDESPLKKLCDDSAKAAPTLKAAQPLQIDLKALARASIAAAGASPGASTMCCALGPYGVRYVPKMGYAWKTVTAPDGTVQSVEYVPNEEPVAVIEYKPPSLEPVDDGTLAVDHIKAYLKGLRDDVTRNKYVGKILEACHTKGDIGGKPKTQAAKDKRKKARQERLDELLKTLTLATLSKKMPSLFKDDPPPKYGSADGVEVAKLADVGAWPVMALIDGSLQVVHGPPNLQYCRFSSSADAGKDGRHGASHQQLNKMLRGKTTNKSATLVVRKVGPPDRYDDPSRRLGVDAGTVTVVHVEHEQPVATTAEQRSEKVATKDKKTADKWKETLAADAAYRAFVVRAVAKEHGIASPTVARPITVKGPFSEDQLKAFNAEGWASLPK
jgi:hypothetical protein